MVILLRYTSAFSEVIYADFYAKILDWNFRLVDENSRILVAVFVSKLNFSFRFCFVEENYRIFVIVIVFVMKINLLSSTKIFLFRCLRRKKHWYSRMITITEQEKKAAIKEIAHVLDITGAYKFECDYAHGQPYAHGGP